MPNRVAISRFDAPGFATIQGTIARIRCTSAPATGAGSRWPAGNGLEPFDHRRALRRVDDLRVFEEAQHEAAERGLIRDHDLEHDAASPSAAGSTLASAPSAPSTPSRWSRSTARRTVTVGASPMSHPILDVVVGPEIGGHLEGSRLPDLHVASIRSARNRAPHHGHGRSRRRTSARASKRVPTARGCASRPR